MTEVNICKLCATKLFPSIIGSLGTCKQVLVGVLDPSIAVYNLPIPSQNPAFCCTKEA